MEDCARIGEDRAGGPDRSRWRDGSRPTATRTLAARIVYLPPIEDPQVYVKITNPNRAPTVHRSSLREALHTP
jgi:hypothetical protein